MTSRTRSTERHVPRRADDPSPDPKRQGARRAPERRPDERRSEEAKSAPRRPDTKRPETRRAREPAIWRGPDAPLPSPERTPEHVEDRPFIRWRYVSGFMVVALVAILAVFFVSDSFYVHSTSVAIGGLETMTRDEVYRLAQIADTQIFWVDAQQVRRNLLVSPTIADAQVYISWGMPMVQIMIEERQPALVWQQGETTTWIDVQGRVMEQRGDRPELMRVVVDDDPGLAAAAQPTVQPSALVSPESTAEPVATVEVSADMFAAAQPEAERISADVVNGALQLRELLPDVHELHYSISNGLGFTDPRGWQVWFGTGTDMPEKVLIYNALVVNLLSRGITPGMFNLINPDNPYYRALGGR
ncbi:MAG: FtsQ-type POTRA domain-containing protein [Anaerolineae bacterium]